MAPISQSASAEKQQSLSTSVVDSTIPITEITPTVNKIDGDVQFSIQIKKPVQQVQKVEFYVEDKLVGAAFSQPYQVNVPENNLAAGTHTVTARVYTATTMAKTTPALFTAHPTVAPTPSEDDSDLPVSVQSPPATTGPSQPTPPAVLATPTNLIAIAANDGTSAQITWDSVAGATSYQVWRDGLQVATISSNAATDTGLLPGHTYSYQITALGSAGSVSAPSAQVTVTMPEQSSGADGEVDPGSGPDPSDSSDSSLNNATAGDSTDAGAAQSPHSHGG
jgi:hypothetical protein